MYIESNFSQKRIFIAFCVRYNIDAKEFYMPIFENSRTLVREYIPFMQAINCLHHDDEGHQEQSQGGDRVDTPVALHCEFLRN